MTNQDAVTEQSPVGAAARKGDVSSQLDWSLIESPARSAFVAQLDRDLLRQSPTLQRVVDLAAALAGSEFAQISLIGDEQFVLVAYGMECPDGPQTSPPEDSLCSVTLATGASLVIRDAATHPWVRQLAPVTSGKVGSYLGVPLRTEGGYLIGALCVFDTHQSPWPDHLARALEDLVSFAAREIELISSVEAQLLSVRELTSIIQTIVAPVEVSPPPGVEVIGRFRSADVGGDWYEWTPLDGCCAITIGDVAGHGLESVATMAKLKSYARAYALESHEPAETLTRISRALGVVTTNEMATIIDTRYDTRSRHLRYASAGHPPPLILRKGHCFFAPLQPGPPIGFGLSGATNHALSLQQGDIVALYTDGLFELRNVDIDSSLEALRAKAEEILGAVTTLEQLADSLIQARLSDTNDDACLVLLRC